MARLTNRVLAAACLVGSVAAKDLAPSPLRGSRQCVLVLTKDWKSPTGVLYSFERKDELHLWQQRGPGIPVVVGRSGLGWGRGVTDVRKLPGPVKREGDGRAPAGVFSLSAAFGSATAKQARADYGVKLPYVPLTDSIEGVDDPDSRYYNQIVDRTKVSRVDWKSSEPMLRLYRWGVVIDHNTDPIEPGAGSCVFLHLWQNPRTGTAGCTAVSEPKLTELLAWLDPRKRPMLVQLTRESFSALARDWKLPNVDRPK